MRSLDDVQVLHRGIGQFQQHPGKAATKMSKSANSFMIYPCELLIVDRQGSTYDMLTKLRMPRTTRQRDTLIH